MARLILDENGKHRAFKLNQGHLKIGSGEGCALRLTSDNVAEIHAELRIEDGVVTLIPKPGVMPPVLLGQPVKQATRLAANAEFRVGDAILRIESEGAAAPAVAARAPQRGAEPKPAANRSRSSVTRQRRTTSKGIPTPVILLVIAVLAGAGYMVAKTMFSGGGEAHFDPTERYREAVLAFDEGAKKRASDELDKVNLKEASADLKEAVAALRKKIAVSDAAGEVAQRNMKGTEWLDSNIKKYVETYLSGDRANRARARLFVKRCDDFKRNYPQHHELGWIERYRSRFTKLAEMSTPDEYDDVAWEVKRLTAAKPRDYELVFRLIDKLVDRGAGGASQAEELRAAQVTERAAYFLDRMQQARYHWEKEEYGSAIEWLAQVIVQIGDSQMEGDAVDYFLKMQTKEGEPLASRYLDSYKKNRPEFFDKLTTNQRLKSAAQSAGLL